MKRGKELLGGAMATIDYKTNTIGIDDIQQIHKQKEQPINSIHKSSRMRTHNIYDTHKTYNTQQISKRIEQTEQIEYNYNIDKITKLIINMIPYKVNDKDYDYFTDLFS